MKYQKLLSCQCGHNIYTLILGSGADNLSIQIAAYVAHCF